MEHKGRIIRSFEIETPVWISEVTVRWICCVCERVNEEPLRNYLFIFWNFSFTALLQILLPLSPSFSLSLSLFALYLPLPISSLFPWLKGNKSAGSCITLHRFIFTCAYFYLFVGFFSLNEMIQFPTDACDVFYCGGGALFLVGRLSCPTALPVGDGDSYQNSCHMKRRPATFHAWISWSSNMPVWNHAWIHLHSLFGCVSFLRFGCTRLTFWSFGMVFNEILTLALLCSRHLVWAKC